MISWWVEAGIDSKMIRDTQVVMRKDGYKGTYWSESKTLGNKPLQPIHILPSLIVCVGGLGLATITFIFEMISHEWRMWEARKSKAMRTFLM